MKKIKFIITNVVYSLCMITVGIGISALLSFKNAEKVSEMPPSYEKIMNTPVTNGIYRFQINGVNYTLVKDDSGVAITR